ncbi:MAG: hypothetical protein RSA52_10425 [Acetivibrio sp.]
MEDLSKLEELALPIMQWIEENCDTYQCVVISGQFVKIIRDECGFPNRFPKKAAEESTT